jgi:hypothetical protein
MCEEIVLSPQRRPLLLGFADNSHLTETKWGYPCARPGARFNERTGCCALNRGGCRGSVWRLIERIIDVNLGVDPRERAIEL